MQWGRLTPSFRTVYAEVLEDMRREIQGCFVDPTRKAAFDLLYKEAWYPEEAAMGNSTLPTVLDADNRKHTIRSWDQLVE